MLSYKYVSLCLLILLFSTTAHAKIIWGSTRNGVGCIYIMDDDGSNQTHLAKDQAFNAHLSSWSPDGTQILFKKFIHNSVVLFLMNPDGTNIRQLTEADGGRIGKCSFSPDGKFIVYNKTWREDDKPKWGVEVLNIKTGKREIILNMAASFCDWSPDGKHIVFTESLSPGRNGTVWIMRADGRNPRRLIPAAIGDVSVQCWGTRWSPDGNQIVFYQEEFIHQNIAGQGNVRIDKAFKLMICNHEGTNIKQLKIPKDWRFSSLDWMDDGNSIVFSAQVGFPMDNLIPRDFEWPPANIYKYHIKTGVITQLTDHPGWDQTVDWISDDVLPVSPKGKKKVVWGKVKQQGSE